MNYFHPRYSLLLDPFSLFFLFVIFLVSIPSAIYSAGYMKDEYSSGKILYGSLLFAVFVFSMAGVVTTANTLVFLVFWEIMSLVSYFLVVFDTEKKQSVNAGALYIIMTHIGTAFIAAAFVLMYKYSGSFEFTAIHNALAHLPYQKKNLLFAFLLTGFGLKAGVVPMHLWLPYAHPQAPSHVSSVMSGVMIKVAIYGFIRFVFFILGINSPVWGHIILAVAAVSCLVGIIYALMENDIKKLLAYSSIENIGIILFGVGASMVFLKMDMPIFAVLALCAGLYHLLNHAVFKSLLFLGAGSVYRATGLRDMEKMGGLIKLMPWTAAFFLAGSLAISAIPPFNGFVSEWLIFKSFFSGAINCPTAGTRIMMGLYASVLALTGGLAAACFVKAFGITFLAMPRSKNAENAKEQSFSMKLAMAFLAVLTLFLGLSAPFIIQILSSVASSVTGLSTNDAFQHFFSLNLLTPAPLLEGSIGISPSLILLMFIAVAAFAAALVYVHKSKATKGLTWDCGYYQLDSRTEYTSTAFSKPFRIAFSFFLKPYTKTSLIKESQYHVKSFRYELYNTYVFKKYLYKLSLAATLRAARRLKQVQAGSIHLYISYIFLVILALMIFYGR